MEYDALGRQRVWTDGVNEERTLYRGAAWHRWGTRVTSAKNPNANANPNANRNPNANGNMIADRADFTQTTHYLYDGDNVVADFLSPNPRNFTLAKSYVTPFLDENLSVTDHIGQAREDVAGASPGRSGSAPTPGLSRRGSINLRESTYFYSADGLGSIRTLTNQQGIVTNTYDYTAFGESRDSHAHPQLAINQRYTYTARESSALQEHSAPMNYRYRQYDPPIGQFTRRDPAGYSENPAGNLYEYVESSPLCQIDPYGLSLLKKLYRAGRAVFRHGDEINDIRKTIKVKREILRGIQATRKRK